MNSMGQTTNQKKEYDYRYHPERKEQTNEKDFGLENNCGLENDCGLKKNCDWKNEAGEEKESLPAVKPRAKHRVLGQKAPCGLHCIKMNGIGVKVGTTSIIENVNLHIHCGNLTVIIGRNGAGKSTLIKAILGEIRHSGSIEFRDMSDKSVHDLRIGYVPQVLNIEKNTPTSVYDMFASYISNIPVFIYKSGKLKKRIREALSLFEAEDLIDKQVCDLSGGELQRVLLSIACTPVPNLLLLDEPVSGIDRNGMELFFRNLMMLKQNYDLAMVLVSHDLDFVEKYADTVILMDKTVLKVGSPAKVFASEEFKEIFGAAR